MAARFPSIWLGDKRGYLTDWVTQRWVQFTGQEVDLTVESWLDGPVGDTEGIGGSYFQRFSTNSIGLNSQRVGLVQDFDLLKSDSFAPEQIDPKIKDFYENTSRYELDVWSQWSGLFKPFGWLLAFIFSRRLQQMNMPISSLDTSKGMTSEIVPLEDEAGNRLGTGWLRKLIATGSVIYVGIYSDCNPPKFSGKCMKIIFPLPNGSATVVMKAHAQSDGSLLLVSSGGGFGEPGFYFIVRKRDDLAWVKYLHSMKESIHVYVDATDDMRADHVLKLWGATFLKLHYRMRPRS